MPGPSSPRRRLRFGAFEADLEARVLRKRGRTITLQDKPFELLARLLQRPGELVTREELRASLWPDDTFVEFDDSLNHAVRSLRKALADSPKHPRFVETVPRRGYRFIAPVEIASVPVLGGGPGLRSGSLQDPLAAGVFVGREREMEELRAALDVVLSGRTSVVMLVGEPGSGKTRTAAELATHARQLDAQPLVGRCHEGASAFWPWIQILRSCVEQRPPEEILSLMGPGAADIAPLDAQVRQAIPELASPPLFLEPAPARFRQFDSITTFLRNLSRVKPLALILDDLHWADTPSLLLLQFVCRELREAHLLVLGTYRDIELRRDHSLTATLAELARHGFGQRIVLRGLTPAHVGRFIEISSGVMPSDSLAATIHEKTEGNPFFLSEIVRLLVSEGRLGKDQQPDSTDLPIPPGVRDVILRRLARLSEEAPRVLGMASVVGREFDAPVVEKLSGLSSEQLSEVWEEAAADRIIVEVPGFTERYGFSHALVRDTLYEDLPHPRRARQHLEVAEALESVHAAKLEDHLPELAHHHLLAGPAGDPDKAVQYAVRAAGRATALLAHEEAVRHYEMALQALSLDEPVDQERRCELLLDLSEANRMAGRDESARQALQEAAEIARRRGSAELLARVALGFRPRLLAAVPADNVDEFQIGLLAEALSALGEEDTALRARVLAHLSVALYFKASPQRRASLSQEALEIARRVDDGPALATALSARHSSLVGPETLEERLTIATELVRFADKNGHRELALRGHHRRILALVELGDIRSAAEEVETYARLAEELRQPFYLWYTPYCRASLAVLQGRFEEAEEFAQRALAIGKKSHETMAVMWFSAQNLILRWQQGRLDGLLGGVKELVEKYPSDPAWRAALAKLYVELDRPAEARAEFERLASNDFADVPRYIVWLFAVSQLADVCAALDDAARAAPLYELLRPYAGHNVVMGSVPMSLGSVSRYLGLLAGTQSRWAEAARHFEDALAMNDKMGAHPFLAHARYDYARMLMNRGRPADRRKARGLLQTAHAAAQEMNMRKLVRRVKDCATPAAGRP